MNPNSCLSIASSEELQRQFVANFLTAWDTNAVQIPVVSWVNYTEWPPATVDAFGTQYGLCPGSYCTPFKEYLQTLGLRSYSLGVPKPALIELRKQINARSWVY